MERAEAEAILDGDRETAIGLLLRLDELVEANQRLVEANERLEARVAELERRLNRSSRNSSLPPSQDPPSAPPRPRGKGSGRKRGGQHGHEGRYRRLLPPEQVDEIVEHWPDRCRSCAHEFAEAERVDAAEPSRRQVAELPPIAVRVTEHRLHRVCCPECAAVTAAEPPAGSRWAFGPRLQAAVVTLAVRNRVSRRDTTELARELFGVELSTGTVDAIVQRAGEALAAPHTRLEQEIKRSPVVNIDETGWKTGGERRMLWGALTRRTAVFRIAAGRHAAEAQTHARRALRRDRLLRPLARLRLPRPEPAVSSAGRTCSATSPPTAKAWANKQSFGTAGLAVAHDLFDAWQQFQQDGDRAALQAPDRAAPDEAPHRARARLPQEHQDQVPPRSSPATCSNAGPPSGPSPTPTASSRPTTTPNAASAAPSSTANSHSAANPNAANAASNDSSPPRSPAGSASNRSSPTSPKSSPPTPAATQYPPSADSHNGLNVARTGDNGVAVARIDGRIGRDGSLRNLVLSAAGFAVRTKSPGNRHLRGEAPVAAASSSPARCETPRCGYTGVAWRSSRCSCPAGTATRSGGRTAKDASATRTEGQDQEEILRPLSYETYKYRKCATVIRYLEVP